MPDKIKLLYDAVSKDYSVGTFDEFSNKLQDSAKRKAFYDGVGAEYNLGDFDTFSSKVVKKAEAKDSGNGSGFSGNGSSPFPSSQVNTAVPSVLTPEGVKTYQKQEEKDQLLRDQLASQIQQAQNAYRTVQGDQLADEVQSINEPKVTTQQPSFSESVANTGSNIITGLKAFIPNTAVAIGDGLQTVFGKDVASDVYAQLTRGGDPDAHRIEAYQRLEELEPQYKVTRGLIEAGEKFDIPGLAAATVDAVGSLVRSAVVAAPTAGLGLYADMMGGAVTSFNREKAKTMGISVQELYDRGENEFMIPATIGAVGARMEAFGLKGTKDLISRQFTGSTAKKLSLLFVYVNKEGMTEWLQTGLDKANESIAKGADATQAGKDAWNEMTSKRGLESYLMGVVGSGGAAGIGRMAKGIIDPKAKKKVEDNAAKAEELSLELQKPDLSPVSRAFVDQEAQKIVSEIADAIETDVQVTESLTPEQRKEVTTIQDEIAAREEVINDAELSETIKESAIAQVDELNNELDNVISKKPEKTIVDTEDKIIKEGKLAEAKFAVDGDQVTYEQKMKELDDRAKKLKETTKEQGGQDAISQQIPDEIPVLTETTVSPTVDQGVPESGLQEITPESKGQKVTQVKEKVIQEPDKKTTPFKMYDRDMGVLGKDNDVSDENIFLLDENTGDITLNKEGYEYGYSDPRYYWGDLFNIDFDLGDKPNFKDLQITPAKLNNNGKLIQKGTLSLKEPEVIKEPVTQVTEQSNGKNETKGKRRQERLLTQEGVEPGSPPSVEPVKEAIAEIKDKKRELVTMPGATDAQLKAQKKDMITQLEEVQSKFMENDETQDRIIRVKDAGYKVSDKGQITFEVEGDGTFNIHVDNIGEAITEVKKAFPDKNPVKPDYKPNPKGASGKAKTTTTETELQDTRDNIAMAKKSGNTKLQEVFEKELERLSKLEIKDKSDQVTTKETVETESDKIIKGNEAIEKANTDLSTLKQVEDKAKKYNSSLTRLAEAKNAGYITEQEFNDFKKKFDQVISAKESSRKKDSLNKLAEAKAKLDSLNNRMGIAQDPKEKAKALFEYHKALVDVAHVYIQEGVETVKEFAEQLGERITKSVREAWNEAKNGIVKSENDFINEQTEILDSKEAKTIGITKKELKRIQEEQGQTEYEPESRTTTDQDQAAARRLINEGYNIADLIKKIEKGDYRATRVEVYILRDYYVSLTARNNSNPTPELLNERQRTLEAIRQAGLTAGQVVQAFDGLVAEEDNLSSYLTAESKYSELTQEEIRELSDKYNAAKEALDKLTELTEKAKREATEKQVQKMLDEEKRKNRTRKTVKADFKAERAGYIEDFRKKLREIRQTQQAVIVPYAQELIAAAPFVRKMVDSYVREGIYDLKTILSGIHNDLKQDIPDITEDDVRDIIAGQYVNPRNTRNGKLAEVRDLERQAKLELQIERLEAGILDTPSRVEKKAKSDKIIELEKEVREIKKRHPELTYPSKLQSRKTWYNNRIKELQDQIRKGDYETVVPPVPVLLDQEALKLKDEYTKFKQETDERRRKKEYEALSELEKTGKKLRGLLDLRRAVQVSVDLSIPARQGISVMLNPRTHAIGAKGYQEMIASIRSRKNYDRLMFDIENDPMYLQSKEDGVVYNDVSNPNANNDEWHNNNAIIDKIPVLRDLVRGSEVAAAAWSNYVRLELYKRQAKFLEAKGKTRENAKSAYEDAAARLMVDTGRGKIPFLKDKNAGETDSRIKQALSSVMFGPRLYSSIFRKLNPLYYFNPKVDKTVRIEALKDMTGYVASQLLLGIMVAAAGGVVSLNPDDPDFLKARWGKRVVDLTAGQSVYIRTFLRVVKAAYMRADPDVSKPDADKYAEYAKKSVGTFWRNKLAPNTSYVWSAFSGKNSIGEKFDPWEIVKIYPMYGDDIIESFKSGNPLDGALVLGIGVLGLGYQEYSKDIRTARLSVYVRDEKTKDFLKRNKLRIQSDINQEVLDPKTEAMVAMTKEQSDEYEKIWGEYVATEIKDRMPELQEIINKDKKHEEEPGYRKKLPGVIGRIKSDATKIAKEEVMGVQPVEIRTIEINNRKYNLSDTQIMERKQLINQYMFKNRSRMISIDKELRKAGLPVTPHEREKLLRSKAKSDATDKMKTKYKKAQGMTLIDD